MAVTESNKCVFILGAGFSTDNGPPVMARFMDRARRNYFDGIRSGELEEEFRGYYAKMLEFHDECLASAWAFKRDWDNIEELYTQADLIRLSECRGKRRGEALCRAIEWTMWHVYRQQDLTKGLPNLAELRKHLARENLSPVFITTNYDTLIERALTNNAEISYYYPGFKEITEAEFQHYFKAAPRAWIPAEGKAPIIKLHGSVNWLAIDGSPRDWMATTAIVPTQSNPVFLNSPDFKYSEFMAHVLTAARHKKPRAKKVTPAFIPPMLGKISASPVITTQWGEAIRELAQARHIWVIGYSFPITDPLMKRLLTQGVQSNRDLEQFVIADIQPKEQWEQKLDDLFPPTMLDTKRVKYVRITAQFLMAHLASGGPRDWGATVGQASANYIRRMEATHTF